MDNLSKLIKNTQGILFFKNNFFSDSYELAKETANLLKLIIKNKEWNEISELIKLIIKTK